MKMRKIAAMGLSAVMAASMVPALPVMADDAAGNVYYLNFKRIYKTFKISLYYIGYKIFLQPLSQDILPVNSNSSCSLVAFREVLFVNKVHRKPENCGARSCKA